MQYSDTAFAKINLCLDVGGKLPDGYHRIRSIMQSLRFGDTVSVSFGGEGWSVQSNLPYLPTGDNNLAVRAALLFSEVSHIHDGGTILIEKRIPVCGGFGGGSSDAAAVLRILNRRHGSPLSWEELERFSEALGADVPFCIRGGTCLATGKGECLAPLPDFAPYPVVICRPDFSCSTPELFRAFDSLRLPLHPDVSGMETALRRADLMGVSHRLFNVFEEVLQKKNAAQIAELKNALLDAGALGASMTGSGSGVFALFKTRKEAVSAAAALRRQHIDAAVTETGPRIT